MEQKLRDVPARSPLRSKRHRPTQAQLLLLQVRPDCLARDRTQLKAAKSTDLL